jgi:hypothetical protein
MLIHEVNAAPLPQIAQALEVFEAQFAAPFAPGRRFRISYGRDRTAFVRTLGGEAVCYAAETDGHILGFIEMAVVDVLAPGGERRKAVYFADVKLLPEAHRTIISGRLLQRAAAWAGARSDFWFTMALDSTPLKPPDYSGRAGIPAMAEAAKIVVVRAPVTTGSEVREDDRRFHVSEAEGEALYRRLCADRYAPVGGWPAARSETPVEWLAHPGSWACGRFEDRRNVRRLIADDGTELRPAYLACFAFREPGAAVDLILAALRRAGALGFRALRLCMTPGDLAALQSSVGPGVIEGTGAAIYTCGASPAEWNLSASEV